MQNEGGHTGSVTQSKLYYVTQHLHFNTPPFRSMRSRPSSISKSSSDVDARRRSSSVRLSFRLRPVRRASTTSQTPSTSTTMTKQVGASQGTSLKGPAPCWGLTMWWSLSRSSLFRGSSPPARHAPQPSLQQEGRQNSRDFWSSWSHQRWKKSQRWRSEQPPVQQCPPQFLLVDRRGPSLPTGHSVRGSCSVSASRRVLWCSRMGHSSPHRVLTLSPTELT